MKPIKLIKSLFLSLVMLLVFAIPVFASSFPAQQNTPLDKEWRIKFSQSVDQNTLENNIVIKRTDNQESFPISPVLDPSDPKVVIVKHPTPFVAGATYQLAVNTGVKDISGKALSKETSLSFTTQQPSYSYSNPAPLGVTQTIHVQDYSDDYTVEMTINDIVRGSDAWSIIYAANKYNNPAKEGYEYILAKIHLKLSDIKDGKNLRVNNFDLDLVSENGRVYDYCSVSGLDPKFEATLYKGASVEGWAPYLVEKNDLHPKLSFGTNYDGTGGIWFKAYTE